MSSSNMDEQESKEFSPIDIEELDARDAVVEELERQLQKDEFVLAVKDDVGQNQYLILPRNMDLNTLLVSEESRQYVHQASSQQAQTYSIQSQPQQRQESFTEETTEQKEEEEFLLHQTSPILSVYGLREESFVRLSTEATQKLLDRRFHDGGTSGAGAISKQLQSKLNDGCTGRPYMSDYQREFLAFLVKREEEASRTMGDETIQLPNEVSSEAADDVVVLEEDKRTSVE